MSEKTPWEDDPHLVEKNNHEKDWLEYLSLTTDYISLPLCLVAIVADIVLIYVILKYRRLKNRSNLFLLNFAAFHIIYIVSTPLFYVVLDTFERGVEVSWYCTFTRVENFGMALLLTFITGYGLDAVIEHKRPHWFSEYEKRYFYIFGFFYFLHCLIYAITATICFKEGLKNGFNFYFLTIYYLLSIILMLYIGIQNKDGRFVTSKTYALNISIIILITWLPLFVCYNLINMLKNRKFEIVLWYIAFLPEYLAYSSSIIVVWKLYNNNKQFKNAFRKIFKRQVSLSDYEELFTMESKDNNK